MAVWRLEDGTAKVSEYTTNVKNGATQQFTLN